MKLTNLVAVFHKVYFFITYMWVVFFLPSQLLPNPPHFPQVNEFCLILVDNLFIFPKNHIFDCLIKWKFACSFSISRLLGSTYLLWPSLWIQPLTIRHFLWVFSMGVCSSLSPGTSLVCRKDDEYFSSCGPREESSGHGYKTEE